MSTASRPPSPPLAPEPVPPPVPASKTAVGAGLGGAGVLIYVVDRLLADDGVLAASMMNRLSPVLLPIWGNWPLLLLIGVVVWVARDKWVLAQHHRSVEAARAEASAAALATSVAGVADGLTGLRSEVHSLRADLRNHADQTDARFAATTSELQTFVRSEVGALGVRVSALESTRRRRPPAD